MTKTKVPNAIWPDRYLACERCGKITLHRGSAPEGEQQVCSICWAIWPDGPRVCPGCGEKTDEIEGDCNECREVQLADRDAP